MLRIRLAVAAMFAALVWVPIVHADDAAIAQQITSQLRRHQANRGLQGFRIGVQVDKGTVTMSGYVSSADQGNLALETARRVPGVKLVVNDLRLQTVQEGLPVQYQSAAVAESQRSIAHPAVAPPAPAAMGATPMPLPVGNGAKARPLSPSARRPMGPRGGRRPVAFAPSQLRPASAEFDAGPVTEGDHCGVGMGGMSGMDGMSGMGGPAPVPMNVPGEMGGGIQQAMYDNPSMPGYAWPSYASYPNYAAVSYPKQYSAAAWPYIGPFYPYPQVPLGWRKVTLEWKDGWWWLDFKSK